MAPKVKAKPMARDSRSRSPKTSEEENRKEMRKEKLMSFRIIVEIVSLLRTILSSWRPIRLFGSYYVVVPAAESTQDWGRAKNVGS